MPTTVPFAALVVILVAYLVPVLLAWLLSFWAARKGSHYEANVVAATLRFSISVHPRPYPDEIVIAEQPGDAPSPSDLGKIQTEH